MISNKNVGYELRCCDPIPFDMAYCRELGNSAIRFLMDGGSGAMVSVQNGHLVPLLFDDIRDPNTGKTRVRNVDVTSETYRVAREYMDKHGTASWAEIEASLRLSPSCPKLRSYWHYEGCRYDKGSFTCSEPEHINACPVPLPRAPQWQAQSDRL